MKRTGSFLGLVASTSLFAAIALVGCSKGDKSSSSANDPSKAPRPAPASYLGVVKPEEELAMRINRLGRFVRHNKPDDRPTITSGANPDATEWKVATLVDGCRRSGMSNEVAFLESSNIFRFYAEHSAGRPSAITALTNALASVSSAAAKDPFVEFLVLDHLVKPTNSAVQLAIALAENLARLHDSAHHPFFRFDATHRTIYYARRADLHGNRNVLLTLGTINIEDLAKDLNAPWSEIYGAIHQWMNYNSTTGWETAVMSDLGGILATNWTDKAGRHELLGRTEIDTAWKARGTGFANTVSDDGFRKFDEHLKKAEQHLGKAWSLDPNSWKTALGMMRVELGQGRGVQRERMWFDRVMAIDTNNYEACKLMSFYLEPRWHGSEEQALRFARTCVTSTKWGGEVPLVLKAVHHSLAAYLKPENPDTYWHRPQVWNDVRMSYEKFFKLNPDAVGYRHDFACDAYLCGKYQVFLDELPKFTTGTNFSFFGGTSNFVSMVSKAQEKVAK